MSGVQNGSDCFNGYHGTVVAEKRGKSVSTRRYFRELFKVVTTAVTLCNITLLSHGVDAAFVGPSLHSTTASGWEGGSITSSHRTTAKFFSWRGRMAGQSGRRTGLWNRFIGSEGILQQQRIANKAKSFLRGLLVSFEVQRGQCMSDIGIAGMERI